MNVALRRPGVRSAPSSLDRLLASVAGSRGKVAASAALALVLLFAFLSGCRQVAPVAPGELESEASGTVVEVRITTSSDDAEEYANGTMTLSSTALELVYNGSKGNQTVGLRFPGLSIPKGATITEAYIQFTTRTATSEATSLAIRGQAADNAPIFTTSKHGISTRTRTNAAIMWTPPPWTVKYQAGADQRTPDLSPIVQEIVDRSGWASGNALAFIITGTGQRIARSFDGNASQAPLLYVSYLSCASPPCNQAPTVAAGSNQTVTLPNSATLNGSVSDDGLPNPPGAVSTTWSKASGPGSVAFGDANALSTTASFSTDGTYVLRLTAFDGELTAFDELSVTVLPAGSNPVVGLTQVNFIRMGADYGADRFSSSWQTVPSIDTASTVYHPPSGTLFTADSEINEVAEAFAYAKGNVFQHTLTGDALLGTWDLTKSTNGEPKNYEPTGITYCPSDDHFYVTNDDRQMIYRYSLVGGQFKAVDWLARPVSGYDPEGVTCEPATARLYVVSGVGIGILIYRYQGGFIEEGYLDLVQTAGTPAGVPSDPEGIVYDPLSGNLFLVSAPDKAIFEFTTAGVFVAKYDLSGLTPSMTNLDGLGIGPSSANPAGMSFYIAARGIDNNKDDKERDGGVFETAIQRAR